MLAERRRGDGRRGREARPGVHGVQAGHRRAQADARFLGHDQHVGGAAQRVRAGQRDRAGTRAGPLVTGPGEAGDQPADRERPGQPGRNARGAEQPVQAFPRRAEGGQQRVDLAMPVTAPGAGPGGRLPDGLAAPRAGGWRMTVAFQAHAYLIADHVGFVMAAFLPRSRADHAGEHDSGAGLGPAPLEKIRPTAGRRSWRPTSGCRRRCRWSTWTASRWSAAGADCPSGTRRRPGSSARTGWRSWCPSR
jgi:hypothetical protein